MPGTSLPVTTLQKYKKQLEKNLTGGKNIQKLIMIDKIKDPKKKKKKS